MSVRELVQRDGSVVVGGAYNAISASLVERAGFDAVWLSSFGVSVAERALPDANLITLSEMLHVGRNMVASVAIPVIADCENGYGDINNTIHTVREFERAGVSAICIDDNQYPKRCSLFDHVDRQLIPLPEMVSKIKAGKDVQRSKEFMLIARTEAIIAGCDVSECVDRSSAYLEAGADLLVTHSKSWPHLLQVLENWKAPDSLVVIPTMFPEIDLQQLRSAGFKMIIYANQAIRASLKAMEEVLTKLRQTGRSADVESEILTLARIHELVGFQSVRSNGQH
jgi:phosphoenolpyruvate phosphomutase